MLRVVAQASAAAALKYFTEGLAREDYYSEGQEIVGKWHGKAAAKLGLSGDVAKEPFAALLENKHPETGSKLTPRNKIDRRVGYDLNFHAPKSLSVMQALTNDRRLVTAFREAVAETMAELEQRVGTRVRRGGANANRVTGNIAWAEFVHFTARPVGGVPDPHLHVHAFAFNLTFDGVESRWKAAEFHDVKTDAPYAEASFHARLANKVAALGYAVERSKHGWEIAGVPNSVIDKFSRRKAQIEAAALKMGITDAKAKDALGAATREGKRKGLTDAALRKEWKSRLTKEEYKSLVEIVRPSAPAASKPRVSIAAREAMDHAFEKCFEKESVILQNRLVVEALKFSVGQLKPEQLWKELSKRELIVKQVKGEILCTTPDILAEEIALIDFVRSGRGKCSPIKTGRIELEAGKWSKEEAKALKHILTSKSQVIALRGGAGVGKTTLMMEAARQIEAAGLRIFAFAQSADASRGTLRDAGFEGANTIAHLLTNKRLQEQTRGQVIWIDEAGLPGVRDLWRVMQIAGSGTRVILTGDSFQHAPVARGNPFSLLQHYSGLKIAEVTQIRRQQNEDYKAAVFALSEGDLKTAFLKLDELGAITQVADDAERYRLLAEDFMEMSRKGAKPPLVVSPTHAEGRLVTEAIRDAKRQAGKLKGECAFLMYENLQLDNADKKLARSYREGLCVHFHQNSKGIVRGSMLRVTGIDESGAVMAKDGRGNQVSLPLKEAEKFQVFQESSIMLGKGDQIRITSNGTSANGSRLNNGNVFGIERFTKKGNIVLSNGAELDARHGHLTHGYCSTSHSSQSKSERNVLVAQSAKSFVASSREQFYVSVSRGKQTVRIYTDDLHGLKQAVGISSIRMSGIELAGLKPKDVSTMSAALNSPEWRKAIRSRVEGSEKTQEQNLKYSRRGHQPKKGDVMSWRGYMEMRRGLVGPDGKSRSKGHPAQPGKKNGTNMANKRRSFLRATQLSTASIEHVKPPEAKKSEVAKAKDGPEAQKKPTAGKEAPPRSRAQRMTASIKSAASQFRKVRPTPQQKPKIAESQKNPPKAKMKQSETKQAAKHAVKERAYQDLKRSGTIRKLQEVKQKQAAPPPTIRRK